MCKMRFLEVKPTKCEHLECGKIILVVSMDLEVTGEVGLQESGMQ